ncbi:hypothetical protein, partial [Faecalicoccus acidiformans]|uniref:hypothetical protein n=1 Tax=Faecalicoccus acidiformans TaxID=915173 RepID=UPI00320849F9
ISLFWRFRVSRDEQPEPPSSLDGYSPHEAPQELAFLQASKLYHQDFIFNIYSSFMCKGRAYIINYPQATSQREQLQRLKKHLCKIPDLDNSFGIHNVIHPLYNSNSSTDMTVFMSI